MTKFDPRLVTFGSEGLSPYTLGISRQKKTTSLDPKLSRTKDPHENQPGLIAISLLIVAI